MSDNKRVCPHCGKSDGLAWVRRWNVAIGKLEKPEHIVCALEEMKREAGEQRAAMN
jgi:hypothetical protein